MKLTAAPAEEGGAEPAAQQETPPPAEEADGGSDTLAIIALVVGVAALAVGLFAIFSRRGERTPGQEQHVAH